jgi:hypothetical protein
MPLRANTNSSALILPPPGSSVTNVNLGTNELRDIKPPVPVPAALSWLWWTLAAIAILGTIYWAWRRWKKGQVKTIVPERIIPPHERARQKLQEALALIDRPKPFCITVSQTIRVYLEERFDLHAPERTTEEFLAELKQSALLEAHQKESLAEFLARCDLVKFARYEPEHYELQKLHDTALRLVNQTEPPVFEATTASLDTRTPAQPTPAA